MLQRLEVWLARAIWWIWFSTSGVPLPIPLTTGSLRSDAEVTFELIFRPLILKHSATGLKAQLSEKSAGKRSCSPMLARRDTLRQPREHGEAKATASEPRRVALCPR